MLRARTRRPGLALAAALLAAVAVAAALLPLAAAQTTFTQGACDADSFQVQTQNGCFVGTCARYLNKQGKEAKPGTLKPQLYKGATAALCCRCNAETTALPAAGRPKAPAVQPAGARPSCAADDFSVTQEALCTPTRCAQELTDAGRKPGPGTKIVLKTYQVGRQNGDKQGGSRQGVACSSGAAPMHHLPCRRSFVLQGVSGAPCCRCVVEPATADDKCETNDVVVDNADACTLERCAHCSGH